MASKFVNLTDTLEQWRVKANAVYGVVGDLTTLNKSASVSYSGITGQNASDFTGTPAEFVVTRNSGSYSATITDGGSGYQVGDTILVLGTLLGGESPTHDATITVDSVDPAFAIDGVTLTGTAQGDLISEINDIRTEVGSSAITLATNSANIKDAVNEIESVLRGTSAANYSLNTDAVSITGAINELETAIRGAAVDYSLDTTATDLVAAINEHETDIGTMSFDAQGTSSNADADHTITYVDLGTTITTGLNNLKDKSDLIADELGGIMASDYDGPETNHMDALNALYNSSSLGTLDNTYVRRDGSLTMTGLFQIHSDGITSNGDNLLLKTGAADVTAVTINASNQNVGIGGSPGTHKLKVTGGVNATTGFYYNGDDTDTRYIRADVGSAQNLDIDTTVRSNINLAPGSGKTVQIAGSTVATDSLTYLEWFQDTVGAMVTSNTETGGISAVYDDSTGKITLAIANNAHSHTTGNITGLQEYIEDTVGTMFTGNTESGLVIDYDDPSGKLNVNVNDPVLTISNEATGSATMTNLSDTNISITLNTEAVQDRASGLLNHSNHTGLSATYEDASNRIDLALTADPTISLAGDLSGSVTLTNLATQTYTLTATVADDSHNHVIGNIDNFVEEVEDIVGAMVSPTNTEAGIEVTYTDNGTGRGKLNFDVLDFTLTFDGDVTGNATISNLASQTITMSVNNDSHTHDGRYYTESESDSRFVNTAGDTMTGSLTIQDSNLYVQRDAYIGENGAGDSNLYFYDDNSDNWRRFWWDNGSNEFRLQDNGGTTRTLLHSGNAAGFTVTNATNATNATYSDYTYVTRDDSTNTTYYPVFAPIGSGQQRMRNDANFHYNPSNNTLTASVFSGTATQAQYADLAEKYLADDEYPVGTVMMVGGEAEVTASEFGKRAIGVVSEYPAYLMNKDLEGGTAIALKGRVPLRLMGVCRKGDELIAGNEGLAMVLPDGKVFAIALEDCDEPGESTIEAVIL